MKLTTEIFANKPLSINPDTYFTTALGIDSKIIPDSFGLDIFRFSAIITSGKRVAGVGRRHDYTLDSFLAGMGPIEASPAQYLSLTSMPDNLTLFIQTNSVINADTLADILGLRLINENGKHLNIPLFQTNLTIYRDTDNYFYISLSTFIHSNLFEEVS